MIKILISHYILFPPSVVKTGERVKTFSNKKQFYLKKFLSRLTNPLGKKHPVVEFLNINSFSFLIGLSVPLRQIYVLTVNTN